MTRRHQQISASLATTPTQSTQNALNPEFGAEGLPSSGSRPSGLDRVLLERNLERLLQERGSHPDENCSELGRYVHSTILRNLSLNTIISNLSLSTIIYLYLFF